MTTIARSGIALICILFFAGTTVKPLADPFKTIKIGSQVYMAENLNVSHFRNGDAIPEAKTNEEWMLAGREKKPAWCNYDNNSENGLTYGRLYNWYAVNDPRGLAPDGWHIATDAEWRETTDYLGGEDAAGTKMKGKSGWIRNGNGTNESGFTGLPAGSRNFRGEFAYLGQLGYWWTSTETDLELAWYRAIDQSPYYVYRTNYRKATGMSVRCIKN